MSNQSWPGVSSLVLNEPLLWEKGRPGRVGVSLPESDVPAAPYEAEGMVRTDLNLPDLAELDVVRHYTRLSTWNFGVDTGMYPLGSCTMKYNPKINEKIAALPGFAGAHPLFPSEYSQGALRVLYETEQMLCAVTGLEACSLQPSALLRRGHCQSVPPVPRWGERFLFSSWSALGSFEGFIPMT